jgi:hypothetical protein
VAPAVADAVGDDIAVGADVEVPVPPLGGAVGPDVTVALEQAATRRSRVAATAILPPGLRVREGSLISNSSNSMARGRQGAAVPRRSGVQAIVVGGHRRRLGGLRRVVFVDDPGRRDAVGWAGATGLFRRASAKPDSARTAKSTTTPITINATGVVDPVESAAEATGEGDDPDPDRAGPAALAPA